MAANSTEYLSVEDVEKARSRPLHRSRSGTHADRVEEQDQRHRRELEREMKRYWDSKYSLRPEERSDLLHVGYNAGQRRVRSYEQIEKTDEPAATYKVREARPGLSYDTPVETSRPTQLAIREKGRPHQRKPSIKVDIIQNDPPRPSKENQGKSPRKSPRSPAGPPSLQLQYARLQSKLDAVEDSCSKYLDVEAADPRDLTFAKISEQAQSVSFELQAWAHISNFDDLVRIDPRKREVVDAASRTLDRLVERVAGLSEACGKARPRDLKVEPLPDIEIDEGFESYGENVSDADADENGMPESLGYVIRSHLNAIQVQVEMLKTLTRSLQEATPGGHAEVVAVGALVAEVGKYFGSQETMDRYRITDRFAGRKALDEARYAAEQRY